MTHAERFHIKTRARQWAAAIIDNLEYPHGAEFDDLEGEPLELFMKELKAISDRIYKEQANEQ
jgi:hypothetical protein